MIYYFERWQGSRLFIGVVDNMSDNLKMLETYQFIEHTHTHTHKHIYEIPNTIIIST